MSRSRHSAVPGNGLRSVTSSLDMRGVRIILIGHRKINVGSLTYSPIWAAWSRLRPPRTPHLTTATGLPGRCGHTWETPDQSQECASQFRNATRFIDGFDLAVSVWRQPRSVDETAQRIKAWSRRGGADRRASECGYLQGARDRSSRPSAVHVGHAYSRFSPSCPGPYPAPDRSNRWRGQPPAGGHRGFGSSPVGEASVLAAGSRRRKRTRESTRSVGKATAALYKITARKPCGIAVMCCLRAWTAPMWEASSTRSPGLGPKRTPLP